MINMRFSLSGKIEVYNEHGSILLAAETIDDARAFLRKVSFMSTVVEMLKLEKVPLTFNFEGHGVRIAFMKI